MANDKVSPHFDFAKSLNICHSVLKPLSDTELIGFTHNLPKGSASVFFKNGEALLPFFQRHSIRHHTVIRTMHHLDPDEIMQPWLSDSCPSTPNTDQDEALNYIATRPSPPTEVHLLETILTPKPNMAAKGA
jgi:hypothetical protein